MSTSVTRLRPSAGTTDRYGDLVPGADTELVIDGVGLAPGIDPEDTANGRQGVPIGWTLFCPYDTDIAATDRIRLPDGTVCNVDGRPAKWEHMMTGWQAGLVVALTEYEG